MTTDFSILLEAFFYKYLTMERGCSPNTVSNYRDTFVLLLNYLDTEKNLKPSKVRMDIFDFDLINGFLDWLENENKISISTRNNRLAGIKSFFKYVSYREPVHLNRCNSILAIKSKKTETTTVNYMTIPALQYLFKSFDLNDSDDLRDYCIIATLYESGARVSELIGIRFGELRLDSPSTVVLHGKGKKSRIVPLDPELVRHLRQYLKTTEVKDEDDYIFTNSRGEPLTRRGVDYILQKHFLKVKAENSPLFPTKISPHCMRHSKAMHLLENDVNIIYIRDLLGHASVTTTEIYSKANPEVKRRHLEKASEQIIDHNDYDEGKQDELLSWLKNNF